MRAFALIVFGFSVLPTFAQTVSEVEIRYGKPVSVYSVSEHIWMTPDYSADGQVCRMRLYPRRLGPKTDFLGSQLLFPELSEVLNEIVPPHLRGSKTDGFGQTSLGGGTAWTTYNYENMSFTFIFSYKLDPDVLKKAEAKVLTGPDPEGLPVRKKTSPSLDDFVPSQDSQTEIVTITWNHRPCGSQAHVKRVSSNQIIADSAPADAASICERLNNIKILPRSDIDDPSYKEIVQDPAYEALSAVGENTIPCLIRRITDETLMDDPRQAPKVGKLAVGDIAFFLLVDFGKLDFVELLPAEVQKAYKSDEGVYGYFRLIDENNNRQKLQAAAMKWYEQKYGRSLAPQ